MTCIAFLLVVITIFFFLRSVRSTIIPALSIPVSIVSSFAILALMGYSMNILTLLGLVLVVEGHVPGEVHHVRDEQLTLRVDRHPAPVRAAGVARYHHGPASRRRRSRSVGAGAPT